MNLILMEGDRSDIVYGSCSPSRRMDEHNLVASEWETKQTGADRRVYMLTDAGIHVLREGLEMVKRRKQLIYSLVQFYDSNFAEKGKGGNA